MNKSTYSFSKLFLLAFAFGGLFLVLAGPVAAGTYSHDYLVHINKPTSNSYVGHRVTFTGYNWEITDYSCSEKYAMYDPDYIEEHFIEQNTLGYSNFVRTHSSYHTQKWHWDFWPFFGHYHGEHYDVYTDTYQYEYEIHQFVDWYDVEGT